MISSEIFFELHKDLPREAPGDDRWTRMALELLRPAIPLGARILDLGCGPGSQTVLLAEANPDSPVFALDTHQAFLDTLMRKAKESGVDHRIHAKNWSLTEPERFEDGKFHLLWAEGSLYIAGVEEGLRIWHSKLADDGCFAFSEITWLVKNPSLDAKKFWDFAYPGMSDVDGNFSRIRNAGYNITGHFIIPNHAWYQNYYTPLEKNCTALRSKYESDPDALAVIDGELEEINLFKNHSHEYGYVFYLLQKA